MGYNGSHGCYKMFTEGQVARMNAALDHPAIKPLWQDQNLIETGLLDGTIYLPEINWITSRASYRQNNTEFASIIQEVILQIVDPVISHDIEIIKPNGSSIAITTLVGETYSMTLNDPGTWTIRIPAYRKEISKSIP
jgi:hypothetical protein